MAKRRKPASGSVLQTQQVMSRIRDELMGARGRVLVLERHLANAEQEHREQIAVSLRSGIPEERQAAESIATFWGVKKS